MQVQRSSCAPFSAAALLLLAALASAQVEWCYQDSSCNDAVWASRPIGFCNGSSQSPVNIDTKNVQFDANLTALNFTGFDDNNSLRRINNSGHTAQVDLQAGSVNVSGGGLPTTYKALQFHLHWGNGTSAPGSEHTVDNKRYAMELHLVTIKTTYNNLTDALNDSEGVAAFSFLIEGTGSSNQPESWKTLTSYLPKITDEGQVANITSGLTLNSLLVGVNQTRYYRYRGSLTVPLCNQAVIWTVFKDPIQVSNNLIDLFSTSLYFIDTRNATQLITNVYRSVQNLNNRVITTSASWRPAATPALLGVLLLLLHLLLLK